MLKIAVLWLLNEEGELLLAQRARHKKNDPGVWGPTVTGTLEPGESFDDALVREVEEELFRTYIAQLPKLKTGLIIIDPDEVEAIRWFAIHEILEKMDSASHELVPSAQSVWPDTFRAIELEAYKS